MWHIKRQLSGGTAVGVLAHLLCIQPFWSHSARKKMHLSINLSRAEGVYWGCVRPSAAKVCTQCGIREVRWSMSKQERVKFPRWEWISTTMLELISTWYLPASILNHIHLPCGTERSFQNVTVQAIKDRCWQIYMSKCQYFFFSCRGIRKKETVTFLSVKLIFTLLSEDSDKVAIPRSYSLTIKEDTTAIKSIISLNKRWHLQPCSSTSLPGDDAIHQLMTLEWDPVKSEMADGQPQEQ